ncbi:MAG: pyruvate ferredoxin oxidoreductase, beta subunit [Parcubacteria group bacterium Athens1014_10]|nr:MAG: pyruvate ferredoxin oxidoreductase, beta subunit [Parcubacteria group bacterium Athens1014_10]TSD05192.1 MAG: pyruvate ferredoxin oxidoreductase, beta subunit [Parcubacteria group bacterium Athens0714_12]
MDIKTLAQKIDSDKKLVSGHRTCAGCAIPIIVRTILSATDNFLVAANSTGCMEVTTTIYPYTSWNIPWIHNAFENVAATLSGIEGAFKALRKKGKIDKEIKFVAFGGDGGLYDIGLQSLSGALERGHNCLYVCYNNEAYQNTGGQRSSGTSKGSITTTTPKGKKEARKDLMRIVLAHHIDYAAQAAVHNILDLYQKAEKAFNAKGPSFLNVLSPCTLNWGFMPNSTIKISKLAADTCFWPLYEVEKGKYKLNYNPFKKLPLEEFFKLQKRFSYLLKPENKNFLNEIQNEVDDNWEELLKKSG